MIQRLLSYLVPRPALEAVPDYTGCGVGMEFLVNMMGENKEVPRIGDVVHKLMSCSMGMTVSRHERWRVTGPGRYPRSVNVVDANGKEGLLHVFYMRRHSKLPRTWILWE